MRASEIKKPNLLAVKKIIFLLLLLGLSQALFARKNIKIHINRLTNLSAKHYYINRVEDVRNRQIVGEIDGEEYFIKNDFIKELNQRVLPSGDQDTGKKPVNIRLKALEIGKNEKNNKYARLQLAFYNQRNHVKIYQNGHIERVGFLGSYEELVRGAFQHILDLFAETAWYDTLDYKYVPDSLVSYFKPGRFVDTTRDLCAGFSDEQKRDWYSLMLYALQEPVLKAYPYSLESYRFTWLRAFDNPVAIRFEERPDGEVFLYCRKVSGKSVDRPGIKIYDHKTRLSKKEWVKLKYYLSKFDFWYGSSGDCKSGLDGSAWILEGKKGHKYQAVSRVSPKDNSADQAFVNVCEYLLSLSPLLKDDMEIY